MCTLQQEKKGLGKAREKKLLKKKTERKEKESDESVWARNMTG